MFSRTAKTKRAVYLFLIFAAVIFNLGAGWLGGRDSMVAPQAQAATVGAWEDASHIKVGSVEYIDGKIDSSLDYWANGQIDSSNPTQSSDCNPIGVMRDFNANHDRATIIARVFSGGRCRDGTRIPVTLTAVANYQIQFRVIAKDTLQRVDGDVVFVSKSNNGLYFAQGGGDCKPDEIQINAGLLNITLPPDLQTLTGRLYHYNFGGGGPTGEGTCTRDAGRNVGISGAQNLTKAATNGCTDNCNAQGNANSAPTCESNAGALGWLVCGIINFVQDTVKTLEDSVLSLLQNQALTTSDTTNTIRAAWGAVRGLANALLIIVFLIIIFGQTLSIEAYTVKKSLPRIVAAAILIQFSFLISSILIDISNILGNGMSSLINFGTGGGWHFSNVLVAAGFAGGLVGLLAAISAAASGAALIAALAALIAIGGVFLTLAFRAIAIIFLIVVAPLACLLWVLPNTERFFRMWLTNFTKLLMMYPLMALIFAVSNFALKLNVQTNKSVAGQFLSVIMIVAPLFAVPFVFKWGGQLMSLGAAGIGRLTGGLQKRVGPSSQFAKDFKASRQESRALQAQEGTKVFGKTIPGSKAFGRLGLGLATANVGKQAARRRGALYGAAVEARRKDALARAENKSPGELYGLAAGAMDTYISSGGVRGREELQAYTDKLATMGAGGLDAIAKLRDQGEAKMVTATDAATRKKQMDNFQQLWGGGLGRSTFPELAAKAPDALPQGWDFSAAGAGKLRQLSGSTMARLLKEAQEYETAGRGTRAQFFTDVAKLNGNEIAQMAANPNLRPEDAFVTRGFATIAQQMGHGNVFGAGVETVADDDTQYTKLVGDYNKIGGA